MAPNHMCFCRDMTSALNRDLNRVYPLPPPSSSSSRPQTAASASAPLAAAGKPNDTVATVDLALSDNDEEAGQDTYDKRQFLKRHNEIKFYWCILLLSLTQSARAL